MGDQFSRDASRRIAKEIRRLERTPRNRRYREHLRRFVPFNATHWLEAGGRLTLRTSESGLNPEDIGAEPLNQGGMTSRSDLAYSPYLTDRIFLYTGVKWSQYTFATADAQVTISSTGVYDIFAFVDATGTVDLEAVQWASDANRSTLLTRVNGVLVKDDAGSEPEDARYTRRYLGTVYRDASFGLCDAESLRFVWNYYNRIPKFIGKSITLELSTNTSEQARIEWVTGALAGCSVHLHAEPSGTFTSFVGSVALSAAYTGAATMGLMGAALTYFYDSGTVKAKSGAHIHATLFGRGRHGVKVTASSQISGVTGSATGSFNGIIWC